MKKYRVWNVFVILSILLSFLAIQPVHAATILRAGSGINSGDCGATWETRCSLSHALDLAASGDQIWVAWGIYTPPVAPDPNDTTFRLKNGVAIYGGFAGGETSLDQRNLQANETILSGWFDSNNAALHIVTASGTDASAVLDGFTINFAEALGTGYPNGYGAGILNIGGSPTLANLKITDNEAKYGGGMYNENGSPTLRNVLFQYNGGSNFGRFGGGMYNSGSSPTLIGVTFIYNGAEQGGGMYNTLNSKPILINVEFKSNNALRGGGMYNSGSSPTLKNVTFSRNQGYSSGAGINNTLNSSPVIYNSILWNDIGTEIFNESNSAPSLHYGLVQGGCPAGAACDHLLAQDPQFIRPLPGSENMDLRLKFTSPAIDAGDNTALPPEITADRAGAPRFVDAPGIPDSGNGAPPIVDLGAFEAQQPVFYVQEGGTGAECTSWAQACSNLQAALSRTNYPGQEIWMAAGTYKPTTGTDRSASFQLKNQVTIYGGFDGTESIREQRDWENHITYLSGDIGVEGNASDNSYHVVTSVSTDSSAKLDGVIVTGGNADGTGAESSGGGMYNKNSKSVVTHVVFSNNYGKYGGGVYTIDSTGGGAPLTLDGIVFSGNTAINGGGLYNDGTNPVLKNLSFLGNSAGSGGGMYIRLYSTPAIVNAYFAGNTASSLGGGLVITYASNPTLINVVFTGNSAADGGGINIDGDGTSATLINVTFFDNTATAGSGGAIRYIDFFWMPTAPTIYNSILWGDHGGEINDPSPRPSPIVYYSFVQGAPNNPTNHIWGDQDPLFEDAAGGNLKLQAVSPAIDVGDNSVLPVDIVRDLAGNLRKIDYPGKGTDSAHTVDLGAYETALPYQNYIATVSK